MFNQIHQGDCLDTIKRLDDNSIDAIVTDPPYGLSFMGKKWDYDVPSVEIWQECLRVLKPGGYLLAFAGTRTQHRMAVRIEDAGFEIRDMIAWIYGSGFPKSLNIGKAVDKLQGNEREVIGEYQHPDGKQRNWSEHTSPKEAGSFDGGWDNNGRILDKGTSEWEGWGTALKPALEPITVARKPIEGTVAENCLKWGVGGINIDECRVGTEGATRRNKQTDYPRKEDGKEDRSGSWARTGHEIEELNLGRFPANLIHDGSDEVVELFPNTKGGGSQRGSRKWKGEDGDGGFGGWAGKVSTDHYISRDDGTGSASRFFYKASFNYLDICQDQSQIEFAQYAESKLIGQEKLTVQEAAEILEAQEDLPYQQELQAIQGFIGSYKNYSQNQKDVNAEKWESTDIILIMLNLLKLSGYVQLAIEGNTNLGTKVKAEQRSEHQRFLYQAKASKSERNKGCEELEENQTWASQEKRESNSFDVFESDGRPKTLNKNNHPTVKPIALMEYLVKLISKPNHIILDPFAGSGSTLIACKNLNRNYIGCELNEEYIKIAQARLGAIKQTPLL